MKSIVITGHTGVVGSRLHKSLAERGTPLVLVNSSGMYVHKPGRMPELVGSDVFDCPMLLELIDGAEAFVNLAAAHSSAVSGNVVTALLQNVLLTDYFAHAARKARVKTFLYASSAAIYYQFADPSLDVVDEATDINVDDGMLAEVLGYLDTVRQSGDYSSAFKSSSSPFPPEARINSIQSRAAYAFGKYAGELAVLDQLSEARCVIMRLANVFGPGDHDDRIVPKFIRTALEGKTVTVFDWSRNIIWIDDIIYMIEKAINSPEPFTGVVNAFSPGNTISLWELAQLINKMVGGPGGNFLLDKEVHEPYFEFTTGHKEILPANPVGLKEGLARILLDIKTSKQAN